MANRAIKYRIYPTEKQRVLITKTFGCCRKVWNLMLSEKKEAFRTTGEAVFPTPAKYKKEYPYLKEVDSLALANTQLNLSTAYKNCYKDKNTEPPKFKSRHKGKDSYTTNCQTPKKGQPTIRIGKDFIHLPKIGDIKAVIHRKADPSWNLKSATVSRDRTDSFYVSVLYEYKEIIHPVPVTTQIRAIGLDYKSDGLYFDSEGRCADMPKRFRNSQRKLARAQRKLAKKLGSRKGEVKSNNFYRQQMKVNRIYRKAANQRLDQLHKQSTAIAKQYDAVCIEDLDVKAMANKGFGNGKATLDNGWGMFTRMLAYKLDSMGKYLIRVDRWYPSSQICHVCGHRQPMPLNVRTYVCPDCGSICDRDYNAAINIRNEGIRILFSGESIAV